MAMAAVAIMTNIISTNQHMTKNNEYIKYEIIILTVKKREKKEWL